MLENEKSPKVKQGNIHKMKKKKVKSPVRITNTNMPNCYFYIDNLAPYQLLNGSFKGVLAKLRQMYNINLWLYSNTETVRL